MKKSIFKIVSLLTVAIVVCSFISPVHAEEPDVGANTLLKVKITNDPFGIYDGSVTVTFTITTPGNMQGREYVHEIDNYSIMYGFSPLVILPLTFTYDISFDFGGAEGFILVTEEGGAVEPYTTTEKNDTLVWKVVKASGSEDGADDQGGNALPSDQLSEIKDAHTSNPEADLVFNTFLDAVKGMEGDPNYDAFFLLYHDDFQRFFGAEYEKHCAGTMEDWEGFTPFQRFIYYETYVRLVYQTPAYSDMGRYETKSKYDSSVTRLSYDAFIKAGAEKEAAAYRALTDWQWEYYLLHGTVYNFVDGVVEALKIDSEVTPAPPDEAVSPSPGVSGESNPGETAETSPGIWDETKNKMSGLTITLTILGVLLAALAVIYFIRRQKSREE